MMDGINFLLKTENKFSRTNNVEGVVVVLEVETLVVSFSLLLRPKPLATRAAVEGFFSTFSWSVDEAPPVVSFGTLQWRNCQENYKIHQI